MVNAFGAIPICTVPLYLRDLRGNKLFITNLQHDLTFPKTKFHHIITAFQYKKKKKGKKKKERKKRERYRHWFNVNIPLLFTIIIGRMVLFSAFGHYMLPIPIPCWYKLNPSNLPSESPIQMPSCPCPRQIIPFYAAYTHIAFTATPLAWIYHLFNAPIPREVIWISRTNEFCNRIETL